MPLPGKTMTPIGKRFEHRIVALERRGLCVRRPVGAECDLRNVAGGRPFGGDEFGAFRRAAVHQRHVGMFGERLVEPVPDHAMIVVVERRR